MEKDKIFFAPEDYKGVQLTTTSAGFIANLAKELYRQEEKSLEGVCFVTTTVSLLGSSSYNVLREGCKSVKGIKESLKKVAELKSLIAWLREAIKAKEKLVKEANVSAPSDYGIVLPEIPVREAYISEDDVIASWGIKQRNRCYYLNTLCAEIGEYIHPDGMYSKERESLLEKVHAPHQMSGSGRDAVIYSYTPSLAVEEVEATYMDLQQTYREYQAELNSMKHSIEEAVNKDMTEKNLRYEAALSEYNRQAKELEAKFRELKHAAVLEAQNLKILIPDNLMTIFKMVKEAGK